MNQNIKPSLTEPAIQPEMGPVKNEQWLEEFTEVHFNHEGPYQPFWPGQGYGEIVPLRRFFNMDGLCKLVGIVPDSSPAEWIIAEWDTEKTEFKVVHSVISNTPSANILSHLTCESHLTLTPELQQLIYPGPL